MSECIKVDNLINKLHNYADLTPEDYNDIESLLKKQREVFFEGMKDIPEAEYPINLIKAIQGEDGNIWIVDEDTKQLVMNRFEYIMNTTLPTREKAMLCMRYRDGKTLEEIGKATKLTKERVRQILMEVFRKLRHPSRFNYIFAPRKLIDEVNERTQAYKDKKLQLNSLIIETIGHIKTLAKALKEVGATVNIDLEPAIGERELDSFGLSVRTYNCLKRAGINTIAELASKTPDEMTKVRNLGRKSMQEVQDLLLSLGLTFADEEDKVEETPRCSICDRCASMGRCEYQRDDLEECDDFFPHPLY